MVARTRSASGPAKQVEDVERLEAELAEIRREADWRMSLAMRMWEGERQAKRQAEIQRRLMKLNTGTGVEQQVEYAACSMVYQADRMSREMRLIGPAAEIYRQVSEGFPNTPWAALAKQRLADLRDGKAG
jgi:hypothetical protein